MNDRECALVVVVVGVIRMYVECCEAYERLFMVLCAAVWGIGCCLVLMVCVVDGQRQLEAERVGCLRMCLRCGLVQTISTCT